MYLSLSTQMPLELGDITVFSEVSANVFLCRQAAGALPEEICKLKSDFLQCFPNNHNFNKSYFFIPLDSPFNLLIFNVKKNVSFLDDYEWHIKAKLCLKCLSFQYTIVVCLVK